MAKLQPFDALTFNVRDHADVSSRIAPPYDVLDEAPKRRLLQRDPRNIVAIDLPVTPPKTVGPDSAYAEAAVQFDQWLSEGVLVRRDKPCIFAYEQVYDVAGQQLRRRGLFAALGLEPFNQPNGIFRHEMTIQGGIDDRYKLTEATDAQLSPIFGIFSDPGQDVAGLLVDTFHREPDFHGTTESDGVLHRCWAVDDPHLLAALQQQFAKRAVFIADGHHRYTTALKFHEDHPCNEAAATCMFVLVAAEDPGMIVLPTHRVITGLSGFSFEKLAAIVEGHPAMSWAKQRGRFGVYDPATGRTHELNVAEDALDKTHADKPQVWRRLDVAILHELLIDQLLRPAFGGGGIGFKYTADLDEMKQLAGEPAGGESRLGIVMHPTPLDAVMQVSLANQVMPPKSTYFYPKLATGLVIKHLAAR